MPGLRVEFSFYGDEQLNRELADIADRVEDARPAWDAIADDFVRAERLQFATEGHYGSAGWAPLSPRYAAWKARHFPGKKILERTGDLKDSLTQRPLGVEIIEPQLMILGSDVDYGGYHQRGEGQKQRRPVELPESLRRDITKRLQRFIRVGHP